MGVLISFQLLCDILVSSKQNCWGAGGMTILGGFGGLVCWGEHCYRRLVGKGFGDLEGQVGSGAIAKPALKAFGAMSSWGAECGHDMSSGSYGD